jgi:hypothetical protein
VAQRAQRTAVHYGTLTRTLRPVHAHALLFRRTTLGFSGQIFLFFQHTKRVDS